jgi:hypothetical protein
VPPCCLWGPVREVPLRLEEGVLTDDITDRSGGFRPSAGATGSATSCGTSQGAGPDTWGSCAALCGSSAPPGAACAALYGSSARATRAAGCPNGASGAAVCSSGPSAPCAWRWPNAGQCRQRTRAFGATFCVSQSLEREGRAIHTTRIPKFRQEHLTASPVFCSAIG